MNVLFKTKPDLPRAFLQFEVGNIFLLNYYTSAYFSIFKSYSIYFTDYLKITVNRLIPCKEVCQFDELIHTYHILSNSF